MKKMFLISAVGFLFVVPQNNSMESFEKKLNDSFPKKRILIKEGERHFFFCNGVQVFVRPGLNIFINGEGEVIKYSMEKLETVEVPISDPPKV